MSQAYQPDSKKNSAKKLSAAPSNMPRHRTLLRLLSYLKPYWWALILVIIGTVLGIISSFLAITDGAMQDPTMLAAGVSQALITTAAGMIVAIPALVAYRYFQRRIIDINAQFETQAGLMIQELYDYQLLDNTHASTMSLPANGSETTKTKGYELSLDTSDLETAATAT